MPARWILTLPLVGIINIGVRWPKLNVEIYLREILEET
jgi:hypothetical protein